MAEHEHETDRDKLIELIGPGKVAVVEGPLTEPVVLERRAVMDDTSLQWAIDLRIRRARGLAESSGATLLSIVHITPAREVELVAVPRSASEITKQRHEALSFPLVVPMYVRRGARLGSSLLIVAAPESRKYIDLKFDSEVDVGPKFSNKTYRYKFDGTGYARRGQYLLVNGGTEAANKRPLSASKAALQTRVEVHYSFAEGITVRGDTKPYKNRIQSTRGVILVWEASRGWTHNHERAYSFSWSGQHKYWYVPQSWKQLFNETSIREVADALKESGVPITEVVYHKPPGLPLPEVSTKPPVVEHPDPPGWPPVPIADASKRLNREGQLRLIPRYGRDDYRWHRVLVSARGETETFGLATNIDGHRVIAYPPSPISGDFWTLAIDGERWGNGEHEIKVLAQRFHDHALPELEPVALASSDDSDLETARAGVRERKAQTRRYTHAAVVAGVPICPQAVYGIEPAPQDRPAIKARGEVYLGQVKAFRALREFERYALRKRKSFPKHELGWLGGSEAILKQLLGRGREAMALDWARDAYDGMLESAVEDMNAREPAEAARVLDACVRDVETGRRRERANVVPPQGQAPEVQALPLDERPRPTPKPKPAPRKGAAERFVEELFAHKREASAGVVAERITTPTHVIGRISKPAPETTVEPPAVKPKRPLIFELRDKQPRRPKPPRDPLLDRWKAFVRARQDEREWSPIADTDCLDAGEGITVCPANQIKPVGACPPTDIATRDKSRQIMLCGDDLGEPLFVRKQKDARPERASIAQRKRAAACRRKAELEIPSDVNFDSQQRFLDQLLPSGRVFEVGMPFELVPVIVAPPNVVETNGDETSLDTFSDELPANASFVARVVVGVRYMSLRDFVDGLDVVWIPYAGPASPETVKALVERIPDGPAHFRTFATANDIEHRVVDGRSLYWLHHPVTGELIGPIDASGKLGPKDFRDQLIISMHRVLPLPDELPFGWTLDDTVVVSASAHQAPIVLLWNTAKLMMSTRRDGQPWAKAEPLAARATWMPRYGFADFPHEVQAAMVSFRQHAGPVRFRVAGPWLGRVWPSDFDASVVFDPPTGGQLDLEQLAADLEQYKRLLAGSPRDKFLQRWVKLAPKRIAWAKRYVADQAGKDKRKPTEKPTRDRTPPREPSREREAMVTNSTKRASTTMTKPAAKPKPESAPPEPTKPPPKKAGKKASKKKAAKKPPPKKQAPAPPPETPKTTKKPSKKKAAKKKATKKKSDKPRAPNWRYTNHRNVRHRFREVDNTFVVERETPTGWVTANAAAAKAIHEQSESACALAARILPTCGASKLRLKPPSAAEKQSMRKLLGL